MGDATYDAVIIGGGNKGLTAAMYLAKYGGMSVGVFEKRHEAGGGWSSEEGPAPGFIADYHASAVGSFHSMVVERDFPEWTKLGGKLNEVALGVGAIFKEDDSCIISYNRKADPTKERTAESIARFSQRDAETWMNVLPKLNRAFIPALLEWAHNPAAPPGVPDALDRLLMNPDSGFDPSWAAKTPLQVARDIFESDALISMILRNAQSWGFFPDIPGFGFFPVFLVLIALIPRTIGVCGGTHNWAHAAVKIILTNGGKIFTEREVDNVLIENGKATGVSLTDGTQVRARKLVISTLDPYNLCFRLIGKEYFSGEILTKVEKLERRYTCITWYTWALHERPNYKAASFNPDINEVTNIVMISNDPQALVREQSMLRVGPMPDDLQLLIVNHSLADKARAPEGKHSILTEQFVLPANALTEAEWLQFKKSHAEDVMKLWQEHTTNMSWDKVTGYVPLTPYDHCRLANMAPTGNWAVIDHTTSQFGRFRPVPELANHETPIKNLYATGSAWHPFAAAACWQGYNCYKVIAQNLGLKKPWEESGNPW